MANGVEQQIGIGNAQVLPTGPSHLSIVPILNRQKQYLDETERYNQQVKKQEEKDLYGIVGDALNLRDFNPVIHDEVRRAKTELAKQLMTTKPSLAEAHLAAQNYAQGLGLASDQFNQADKLIALSREENKGDKRLKLDNIEALARKDLLNQYKTTGKLDLSVNPFDKAIRGNPDFAVDSDYVDIDFKNVLQQKPSGKFKEVNRNRGYDMFNWNAETYPDYYQFTEGNEDVAPTIKTKGVPSGLKDENGNEIPMLDEGAWGLISSKVSNQAALDKRLSRKYPGLDLESEEAEKRRRIEAYNELEAKKPPISKQIAKAADPVTSFNFKFGSGFGQTTPESQLNSPVERIRNKFRTHRSKGQPFMPAILLEDDEADIALEAIKKTLTADEAKDVTLSGYNIIEGDDGSLRVFDKTNDDFVAFIGKQYEVKEQAGVKEKRDKQAEVNKSKNQKGKFPLPSGKPRTVKQNGVTYTWNEQSGQYQ